MRQNFIQTLRDYVSDATTAQSLGAAMLQCNGMIVPEIAPEIALLIPNFQRPVVTNNDAADYNLAGGGQFHVAGAPKNRYEGQIQVIETDYGQATAFAELLMASGGTTNCLVYDGRPDRYTQVHELRDCAITFEPIDYDGEGVSTIVRVQGTMKYNYYGLNANLGSSTEFGRIKDANKGTKTLEDRATRLLNSIYSGNTLINAMRELF